jgi:hypothetical protein
MLKMNQFAWGKGKRKPKLEKKSAARNDYLHRTAKQEA